MKIALISDIHGNLPALDAVWEDMQQQQPDRVYCLGDLVNFAGWDNEVVDFIRERQVGTVLGNHDEGIGLGREWFDYSFDTEEQRLFGIRSIALVNRTLTQRNREFLENLPFSISLAFRFPFHHVQVMLTHGSPVSNGDYIREDAEDRDLIDRLDEAGADVLICGHTHRPFHRAIYCEEDNRKLYRHVINAGSVGKPKHGDNRACYVMLELDGGFLPDHRSSVAVRFHYVSYDTEAVIRRIHYLGLGSAYDEFLRKGTIQQHA